MTHLKALKLATAEPMNAQADPVKRTRAKVIEALAEQKRAAEAKIAGEAFVPTHMVWRKNEADERVQVEQRKRFRSAWFENAAGQTFFSLRYAGKTIELAKGKNAIEIAEFTQLPGLIDTLIAAVDAGELDTQLGEAAAARSRALRSSKQAA
ncbi:DUF6641 family protein [Fulvimarina sp. 2208YS6-2-32]|uniref:DUF6641 family protein n=1 Tax=Fulvimarina uroteuthidis TaxID=3098149 RepID=A0ABU5I5Y7_9HYPH|nr:DUF6641 family protein [Fulvimarina sp. 2208YS6-2-32]MDY8110780.1 DUF6641 family protein [Fulvimarina sp. 2208YS6-2-32]